MSIILANFGKYAISDCPFITCQNFQFWQVCSSDGLSVCLLLAKIFNFGKYVRLTVCLFVCLSVIFMILVAPFKQSTLNLAHIWNLHLAIGVYFLVMMTSSMTSSGPKEGQILKEP